MKLLKLLEELNTPNCGPASRTFQGNHASSELCQSRRFNIVSASNWRGIFTEQNHHSDLEFTARMTQKVDQYWTAAQFPP
jgi:hypothetical protein